MSSNLKVNTILPSVGSNIGLGTNGGNLNVDGGCKVQVGTALTLGHTVGVQFATQNLHSAGFEVNQINASGIITASQFKGDGSQLTGLPAGTTINTNADNRIITGSGTANTLNGESNLTFDGNNLQNLQSGAAANLTLKATSNSFNSLILDSNRSADTQFAIVDGRWNGNIVNRIQFVTGSDGTNKDDGYMAFHTRESGASLTERLRIASDGKIFVGGSGASATPGELWFNDTSAYSSKIAQINGGNALTFHTGSSQPERMRIAANELRFNSTAMQIHLNTSDGSDTGYLNIGAAGGANNQNRGAQVVFYGNEFSNNQGQLGLLAGNSGSTNGYLYVRTGGSERFRITSDGYLNFYNDSNTNKGLRWYNNVGGSAKAASIEWGNGNANWEFKHFRNDNQANNPYANIDFYTGDWTTPTRALRITNDGNHIREKHSRFACQITYQNKWYSQGEIIQFNTHVNVGNDFDNSNNKYTAPVDGTYYFFFHTNVIRNGSGTYYTDWYKNGSTIVNSLGGRMYDYYTGSGWNNLSGFIGLDLSEGDYISVHSGSADTKYDGNTYGQLIGYLVG